MTNTRYQVGDKIVDKTVSEDESSTAAVGEVVDIEDPQSSSPDYIIQFDHGIRAKKASDLKKAASGSWKDQAVIELENRYNKVLNNRSDKPNIGDSSQGGFVAYGDEYEFDIFKNYENAKRNVVQHLAEEIEMNPSRFADWLIKDHAYMNKTDLRMMADDLQDSRMEGLVHDEDMEWEEARKETEDYRQRVKEKLEEDPIGYLTEEAGLFRKSEIFDQGFIRIDGEEAAKEVVANDGVVHSVSIYGGVIELDNGAIAYEVI